MLGIVHRFHVDGSTLGVREGARGRGFDDIEQLVALVAGWSVMRRAGVKRKCVRG